MVGLPPVLDQGEGGRLGRRSPRGALLSSDLAASPPFLAHLQGPCLCPGPLEAVWAQDCPALPAWSIHSHTRLGAHLPPMEKYVQAAKVWVRWIWIPVSVPALVLLPANGEKPVTEPETSGVSVRLTEH